jgi:hypothetical protein
MKAMLFPVGCIGLLDFVRRNLSAFPGPTLSILAFNAPNAAWRFIFDNHHPSMLARAHSIQHQSAH